MADVNCRELGVQQNGQTAYYIYTFKYGPSYTGRFGKQQIMVLLKSRIFGNASGALIRVSTPMEAGEDMVQAGQRAKDFMRAALPYLDQGLN